MKVYRLTKKKYSGDLSGKGAETHGGRWNEKGAAMVYTGNSRALCALEIAVHTPLGTLPKSYFLNVIEIPDDISIEEISAKSLLKNWRSLPHGDATQKLGKAFIKNEKNAVLKVPSAIVDGEYNFLINPLHQDSQKIKLVLEEKFWVDERLFK